MQNKKVLKVVNELIVKLTKTLVGIISLDKSGCESDFESCISAILLSWESIDTLELIVAHYFFI